MVSNEKIFCEESPGRLDQSSYTLQPASSISHNLEIYVLDENKHRDERDIRQLTTNA